MYRFCKHVGDFILALSLLLIFTPPIGIFMLIIMIVSPGYPIYKQVRVGKNRETFVAYKLRTRHINTRELERANKISSWDNHHRGIGVFPFGAFLRKFSLDELLQLVNVLKGEMSVIGPRPPQPEEIVNFWEPYTKRFDVLPGLTGWAQIKGRDRLPKEEQLKLDCVYVEKQSIWMDLLIAIVTPGIILFNTGS